MSISDEKKGFLVLSISKKHSLLIGEVEIRLNKIKRNGEASLAIHAPKEQKIILEKCKEHTLKKPHS